MLDTPLVTVWIPTFNRKELLERALLSVLNQDYQNIEIFIVDNGSVDGTSELVNNYIQKNNKIVYHRFDSNKGACAARNYAIINASGDLVTGLDDDDEFLPGRVSQLVKAYDEKYAFVCTGYYWDYGTYRKAKIDNQLEINLSCQLNYNQASNQVLVSKKRIIDAGLFDESLISCQDWDMWTRLIIQYGVGLRVAKTSYVVHTAHDKPRITGIASNRLKGLKQFYTKHQHLMTKQNQKCFNFLYFYNTEKKLGFIHFFKFFCWPIKDQVIRYLIASYFPKLAKKRLARLRNK